MRSKGRRSCTKKSLSRLGDVLVILEDIREAGGTVKAVGRLGMSIKSLKDNYRCCKRNDSEKSEKKSMKKSVVEYEGDVNKEQMGRVLRVIKC